MLPTQNTCVIKQCSEKQGWIVRVPFSFQWKVESNSSLISAFIELQILQGKLAAAAELNNRVDELIVEKDKKEMEWLIRVIHLIEEDVTEMSEAFSSGILGHILTAYSPDSIEVSPIPGKTYMCVLLPF